MLDAICQRIIAQSDGLNHMNIGFFISDHGFGHIMRNLSVIVELLERENRVVVKKSSRLSGTTKFKKATLGWKFRYM